VIRTAVIGASGYTGSELVGLLAGHPMARIEALVGDRSAGARWEDLNPAKADLHQGDIVVFDPDALAGLDAAFLALPSGESAAVAQQLQGRVKCVIDLSGDLRLADAASYEHWYGRTHPAPDLIGTAVYGLPELFGEDLADADLVACAGCYSTVTQLAAAPALLTGSVAPHVAVSAVSGTSGAGRTSDSALSFSEMFGDVRSYRIGRHQHTPEMINGLSRLAGRPVRVSFVPHLVPIERGIHATVVMDATGPIDQDGILDHYRAFYRDAPFVRVLDPADRLPSVRNVVGTNVCEVAPVVDSAGQSLVVVGAIDNLVKGAAGQAIQVLNRRFGLPETAGLMQAAGEST